MATQNTSKWGENKMRKSKIKCESNESKSVRMPARCNMVLGLLCSNSCVDLKGGGGGGGVLLWLATRVN